MTWQCNLLDIVGTRLVTWPAPAGGGISGETRLVDAVGTEHSYEALPAGTMFFVPQAPTVVGDSEPASHSWPWYWASDQWLSDYYREQNTGRRPLFVILPGRHLFLVDGKCWKDGKAYGGWTVTGDAPNITISPSINIGGNYHGWLQNGVISEDCEGRKFDAAGFLIK